jgi:hypothetical protein
MGMMIGLNRLMECCEDELENELQEMKSEDAEEKPKVTVFTHSRDLGYNP